MNTSQARIEANRKNAERSTGPKTVEGKEASRQNSLKHGLTGNGIVLSEKDAAEVERRTIAFREELIAIGEVGQVLARSAALHSVRMERAADQQTAALSKQIRQIEADFVPPEGVDDQEADRLRQEAVRIAMFDPSKEATLARKYEAAAERGFYRALKLLRQMDRESDALLKAEDEARVNAMMGSILATARAARQEDPEFDALSARLDRSRSHRSENSAHLAPMSGEVDLPFAVGRPR